MRSAAEMLPDFQPASLLDLGAGPGTASFAAAVVVAAQLQDGGRRAFAIRSVVGGNAPYIVLEDGTMLTPGGTYAGWRLKDVDATNLTFDAPQLLVVKR